MPPELVELMPVMSSRSATLLLSFAGFRPVGRPSFHYFLRVVGNGYCTECRDAQRPEIEAKRLRSGPLVGAASISLKASVAFGTQVIRPVNSRPYVTMQSAIKRHGLDEKNSGHGMGCGPLALAASDLPRGPRYRKKDADQH